MKWIAIAISFVLLLLAGAVLAFGLTVTYKEFIISDSFWRRVGLIVRGILCAVLTVMATMMWIDSVLRL